MEKLIDFLRDMARRNFWGIIEIKFEKGVPVLIRKILENVKLS